MASKPSSKPRLCKEAGEDLAHAKRPAPHPGPRCTTCNRAVRTARRQSAHGKYVQATYGISEAQYWALYEYQGGRCAICQRARGTGPRKLAVDHNHKTGEVRMLACLKCNRDVLGHLRDDPAALRRAADMLENPPAREVFGSCYVPSTDAPAKPATGRRAGARRTTTAGGETAVPTRSRRRRKTPTP